MNLSKSKYCSAVQCNKMLWLYKNKPEEECSVDNSSVLDNGTEVGELAKQLLGESIDIEFNSDLNVMINDTNKHLNDKPYIPHTVKPNYLKKTEAEEKLMEKKND